MSKNKKKNKKKQKKNLLYWHVNSNFRDSFIFNLACIEKKDTFRIRNEKNIYQQNLQMLFSIEKLNKPRMNYDK